MPQAKPHVILIAYYFPPAPEIGGLRPFRFYKYLKRIGYECHVITASEQGKDCPPDVMVVPDELRAVWEGAASGPRSARANKELLVRKLMFPGHIGILWARDVAARCRMIVREHPQEKFVLFSTYPPLGALLAGLMTRVREKIPWIADFRDPISGVETELLAMRTRFWNRALEGFTFRTAQAVLANAEAAAAVWRGRYPTAEQKLHVIWNGFDPESDLRPRAIPARIQKLIVHAGALYHGRNPNAIVESLARLRAKRTPEALSANVLLLGSIDAKAGVNRALCEQAQRDDWLELRPTVPRDESQRLMEEADGLLLVQPQSQVQVPGKLFEYICIGRPILALVPRSSAVEEILQKAAMPHVCIYTDDSAETTDDKLVKYLQLPNTPTPANDWFRNTFNAENQTAQLASIVDEIS